MQMCRRCECHSLLQYHYIVSQESLLPQINRLTKQMYSEDAGYGRSNALLVAMGTGILNWVFALPAFFTIDTFGRRPLLLITYPFLCITLLWTGLSFLIPSDQTLTRTAMITTGMYLFEVFYSPGMGPVPFSYSAEAFPMHVRDVGMSWATVRRIYRYFSCRALTDLQNRPRRGASTSFYRKY